MKCPSSVLFLLSLAMVFSLPVVALTGADVSPVTALETVSPTVQSATTLTERSLSVSFSEPLLPPGATTPGNYTLSGAGRGTLSPSPDTVTGSGPYTLTWTGGEMRDGAAVTVTVSGVQDAVGNPLLTASATASAAGIGVAPVFTALLVTPSSASVGDTVTIAFTASEPLDGDPAVTVNGHPAVWVSGAKAVDFTYTYEVAEADAPGMAAVSVSGYDLAGNMGSLESATALEINEADAGLPVRAWPLAMLLGAAGMALFFRARRRGASGGRAFLLIALFVLPALLCATAFAAPPAVSNVSMVQQDNGAGGTEAVITYDLDAPNGPCDMTVSLSKDGGVDGYVFPATSVTGDVSGVAGGAARKIVWDLRADYPEEALPNARIRLTADDGLVQHTLTYTAGANGTITGDSPQVVNDGADGTAVTAVPDGGYAFSQWSDGVLTAARTDTNVMGDITVTASFVVAAVPPVVTVFAVNSGAATTDTLAVTLDNTATGSPAEYMASESPTFSGASWSAYGASPSFTLSGGTGGVKTVYFKVRNAALVESAVVSDTIDLVERTILLPGSVPLVLRWVPSGSYQMGRYAGEADSFSAEDPQHPVTLAYGFWMGKYEVTQQQWIAVRSTWPGTAPSGSYGLGNTYPAYYISWDDTKNFITSLNTHVAGSGQGPLTVRLPSEAEWEYACRAGTQTRFYFGDSLGCFADCSDCAAGVLPGNRSAYMWYCGNNSPSGSKAVGGNTGNAFGLYDMSGNVYEWCEDDEHGTYTGAPNDGSPWIDSPRDPNRMIRGGRWSINARYCRSAYRASSPPDVRNGYIGFRLAAVQ